MANKPAEVAQLLREAVAAGTYPPGSQIPAHRKLASLYGVSVETASSAVQLLVEEGLLIAGEAGGRHLGTFVSFTRVIP